MFTLNDIVHAGLHVGRPSVSPVCPREVRGQVAQHLGPHVRVGHVGDGGVLGVAHATAEVAEEVAGAQAEADDDEDKPGMNNRECSVSRFRRHRDDFLQRHKDEFLQRKQPEYEAVKKCWVG